jgi:ribosomal protein L34E
MLDRQNQGPQCVACGSPMKLSAIEPSSTGQDLRTFTCPECKRVERHIVASAVTEAWLEPQRALKTRALKTRVLKTSGGDAVTHELRKDA